MDVHLTVEMPESAFSSLRVSPAEFAQQMRLAAAVKWYELGRLSQAKAAAVAGVNRHDFLQALSQFGVSPFQVEPDELRDECSRA